MKVDTLTGGQTNTLTNAVWSSCWEFKSELLGIDVKFLRIDVKLLEIDVKLSQSC
jgi:hypothetical protein